nr:uncharacterized protein LOC117274528 [Nicotiana tomentosiformis]
MIKVKEYFDEKFEKLFKIVNKSKGMDDGDADFDLMNYRQYDKMNDSFEPLSDINVAHDPLHKVTDENVTGEEAALEGDVQVFEEVQRVEQQVEEEYTSIDRLSKDGYDEQLSTENVGSKKGSADEVVDTEEHASSCALGSDIAQGNVYGDGDHEPIGTEELTLNDVCTTIGKGNPFADAIAICQKILGVETQEVFITKNTQMLLDIVAAQLNEAGAAEIDKGMQSGETAVEDKRQDISVSEGNRSGSVAMQTPYVSQHVDQISSDASQLLPNPKRRKMSSSPNVMSDTSDIPNFKLCSFSLGSTEGTGSEGNSAAIVIGEERQEHRKQQGVGQVSATMAVDFSLAAEP